MTVRVRQEFLRLALAKVRGGQTVAEAMTWAREAEKRRRRLERTVGRFLSEDLPDAR